MNAIVAVLDEERDAVARRERPQDLRVLDAPRASPATARIANQTRHHRPEQAPDRAGAEALDREQHDQDRERDRHDERVERRLDDLDALDGREHRDRRRDHPVAVEQRRAEDAERDEDDLRRSGA